MIPKIIHYCWFGPAEMPSDPKAFIEGWKHGKAYRLLLQSYLKIKYKIFKYKIK